MVRMGRRQAETVQTDTTRIQTVYEPGSFTRSSGSRQRTANGKKRSAAAWGEAAAGRERGRARRGISG